MSDEEFQDGQATAVEAEIIDMRLDQSHALMAITKSEIDQQIATAHEYPREISKFQKNCGNLACLDQETAQTMFYALPRGGKTIQGPSVRMAEIVAHTWGNIRCGSRIVAIDDKFVTAQGMAHDLETNNAATFECKRRITNREGRRFNDDMIQTTCNAACAIAFREAVFKVVPRSLWKKVYARSMETALGKAKSIVQLRQEWFAYFAKMGVTVQQILEKLGRSGENDVTTDDIKVLVGLSTALRDGDTSVEDTFGLREDQKAKVKPSELNDKLKGAKPQAAAAPPPPEDSQSHGAPTGEESQVAPKPADDPRDELPPVGGDGDPPAGVTLEGLGDELAECTKTEQVFAVKQKYFNQGLSSDALRTLDEACNKRRQEISAEKEAKKGGKKS